MLFHVKRRRNGLHIIRVRASANAHSFRRFSSPTQTRFAGLWVGIAPCGACFLSSPTFSLGFGLVLRLAALVFSPL